MYVDLMRTVRIIMLGFAVALALVVAACGGHDVKPDARSIDAFGGANFGSPCSTAADCPGGMCADTPSGGICSSTCDGSCPEGFNCRVRDVDGTLESICVPQLFDYCTACNSDAACAGGVCVDLEGTKACLAECPHQGSCPTGYTCGADPSGQHIGSYCIPLTNTCSCTVADQGKVRTCTKTNSIGTCRGIEKCDADYGGWIDCSALDATTEICDGKDNDCDGLIDEGVGGSPCMNTVAGIGSCPGVTRCQGAAGVTCEGKTPTAETCNYADDNCNGTPDENYPGLGNVCSVGVGTCQRYGVTRCNTGGTATECSATAGSGVSELCNALDDNCNGQVDETFTTLGQGCTVGIGACTRQGSFVCNGTGSGVTCSATAGSSTAELCNGRDDDCNGVIDNGFPTLGQACTVGVGQCTRQGSYVCNSSGSGVQCSVAAGTPITELCNSLDDDCNGVIDNGFPNLGQACSVGVGQCTRQGSYVCNSTQNGTQCSVAAGSPTTELCNSLDDDCNGVVDNGFPTLGQACTVGVGACTRQGTQVCNSAQSGTQCSVAAGSPTTETCNGIDDDCNGVVDNGFPTLGQACTVGVGACTRQGTNICNGTGNGVQCSVAPGTPGTETCNGLDDNCNGQVDEGWKNQVTLVYDANNACGSCANDCTVSYALPNASGVCNLTGSPHCVMQCGTNAFDLDTQLADGCEFLLDVNAIYVSTDSTGAVDDGTCGLGPSGTGGHPCKSIAQGIIRAGQASKSKIFVANGVYNETVTLVNGKSMYGGYNPDSWAHNAATTSTYITGTATFTSTSHDYAVNASTITTATTFDGFVVIGPVNSKVGGNSYAIYAQGSTALTITNNVIVAGRGGPGSNGAAGASGAAGVDGTGRTVANAATYDTKYAGAVGPPIIPCDAINQNRQYTNAGLRTCGTNAVNGGNGGGNRCTPVSDYTIFSGITGFSGSPGVGALGGAAGAGGEAGHDMTEDNLYCYISIATGWHDYGYDGAAGGNGQNGPMAAACIANSGNVVSNHWVGGVGASGTDGGNGGGGGGGGAGGGDACATGTKACPSGQDQFGGHGGGGGAGGCGGAAGGGSTGGGGAFGIFVVGGSAPTIVGNNIQRGQGGTGGRGGAAGSGGVGGYGAEGGHLDPSQYCPAAAGRGGNGGAGGHGSGGAGACGGSSVGIYTSGVGTTMTYCSGATPPNTVTGGAAGTGGLGGYSAGNQGPAGAPGEFVACSLH